MVERPVVDAGSVVGAAHREQWADEGFFVLERVLSDDTLQVLRDAAEDAVAKADAEMDRQGVDMLGITHRGRRYFARGLPLGPPGLSEFLFGETMAEVCRATLGGDAFLFFEQFVVKGTDKATAFSWHQDSGYVHDRHEPYLTCWITLDDVTEENGTVYVLPYSQTGIRTYVKHVQDEETNDKVGYFGPETGVPVIAPAGSIACFSSVVFHRSGPNLTDRLRRVYLAQYSKEVILTEDGSGPWGEFEPFLEGGERVTTGGTDA